MVDEDMEQLGIMERGYLVLPSRIPSSFLYRSGERRSWFIPSKAVCEKGEIRQQNQFLFSIHPRQISPIYLILYSGWICRTMCCLCFIVVQKQNIQNTYTQYKLLWYNGHYFNLLQYVRVVSNVLFSIGLLFYIT